MLNNSDQRIIRTKSRIRENMLLLLETAPINKITVSQICKMSGINRSTFYAYYEDVYDLHNNLEREFFQALEPYISNSPTETTLITLFKNMIEIILSEKALAKVIFKSSSDMNHFEKHISQYKPPIIRMWQAASQLPLYQLNYLYSFITMGCIAIFKSGLKVDFQRSQRIL